MHFRHTLVNQRTDRVEATMLVADSAADEILLTHMLRAFLADNLHSIGMATRHGKTVLTTFSHLKTRDECDD